MALALPGFRGITLKQFGKRLFLELQKDSVTDSAAQLSYYFLFSLFPFLFMLVTLAAYLPLEGAVNGLLERVEPLMPGDAYALISGHLSSLVGETRPRLLTVGILVSLWSGSRGVDALRKALNLAYEVPESRPFWKTQGLAILMTVSGALLLLIAFALFVLGGELGTRLATMVGVGEAFAQVWSWLRWPFTAALAMLAMALAYFLLPDVKQRFKYITPGSVIGVTLWLFTTFAFTQYVEHFGRFNVTYGSIGGVIVLLIWLYLTGLIFIFGGEVNAIIEHISPEGKEKGARDEGERPKPSPATTATAKSAKAAERFGAHQEQEA